MKKILLSLLLICGLTIPVLAKRMEYESTSGSGIPSGSDGQVQYNNGGSFGGATNLFYNDSSNNVGISTTNPSYNLQVAGTGAIQTLRFGTAYNNILPSGTGAVNQILKTDAAGVITWQADSAGGAADFDNLTINTNPAGQLQIAAGTNPTGSMLISNGASGLLWADTAPTHNAVTLASDADTLLQLSTQAISLDNQTANYAFVGPASGGATRPTFRLLVDDDIPDTITLTNITQITNRSIVDLSGTLPTTALGIIPLDDTNHISGTLPQAYLSVVPLATKVSGTLPVANMAIVNLAGGASVVSGTLPNANMSIISLSSATQVSGTLPAANLAIINLAGGASVVSGTLPSTNIAILPLSTHVSGTLPDSSSPLNITNTTITSNTGSFTTLRFGAQTNTLPSGTGANNQILKCDGSGGVTWQADATGGSGAGTNTMYPLSIAGMKISGTDISAPLRIDAGDSTWKALGNESSPQFGLWTVQFPPGGSTAPILRLGVTAASNPGGNLAISVDVQKNSDADGADIDTPSYASLNTTYNTMPASAGTLEVINVTLTNLDSATTPGDTLKIRLQRDADDAADTLTGDIEFRNALLIW